MYFVFTPNGRVDDHIFKQRKYEQNHIRLAGLIVSKHVFKGVCSWQFALRLPVLSRKQIIVKLKRA